MYNQGESYYKQKYDTKYLLYKDHFHDRNAFKEYLYKHPLRRNLTSYELNNINSMYEFYLKKCDYYRNSDKLIYTDSFVDYIMKDINEIQNENDMKKNENDRKKNYYHTLDEIE